MSDLLPQDIVLRPLITEKTLREAEKRNAYTFQVRRGCNKVQIRAAIEALFKVRVEDVRTSTFLGKVRRMGRTFGRRQDWKKAVVKVRAGDTIEFY